MQKRVNNLDKRYPLSMPLQHRQDRANRVDSAVYTKGIN